MFCWGKVNRLAYIYLKAKPNARDRAHWWLSGSSLVYCINAGLAAVPHAEIDWITSLTYKGCSSR